MNSKSLINTHMAARQTKKSNGKKTTGKSDRQSKSMSGSGKSSGQSETQNEENSTSNQQSGSGNGQQEQKKETGILETVKDIFSPVKPVDKTLEELFEDGLKDMYSAEKQLVKALPKLAESAYSEELGYAFMKHQSQTKKQAQSLEKIMEYLGINPQGKKCAAMEGLIEEANDMIRHYNESPVRDSGLIICAQKVEHYEIAAYGSLCELADVLGLNKIKDTLGRILEEEKETDELLSDLAMDANDDAYEMASNKKQSKKKQSNKN